jgi:hypothetical protein
VCTIALVPATVEELQEPTAPVPPPKEPVKMTRYYWHALVKAVEPTERRIDFVASHEFVDRQGDVIDVAHLDLAEYRRNPILLRDHDPRLPVGVVDRLRVAERGGAPALVGSAVIGDDDLGPHVKETWLAIQTGVLRGISVGFQPLVSEPLGRSGGLRFTSSRLLEISVVSVPACASCLIERKTLAAEDEIRLDSIPSEEIPIARREVEAMVRRVVPAAVAEAIARERRATTGELD